MIPVYPLTEEAILPHIGSPVLAVLQTGQEHVGILNQVKNGRLTLGGTPAPVEPPAPKESATSRIKSHRSKKASKRPAASSALNTDNWAEEPWPDPFFPPAPPPAPPAEPVTLSVKSLAGLYLLYV